MKHTIVIDTPDFGASIVALEGTGAKVIESWTGEDWLPNWDEAPEWAESYYVTAQGVQIWSEDWWGVRNFCGRTQPGHRVRLDYVSYKNTTCFRPGGKRAEYLAAEERRRSAYEQDMKAKIDIEAAQKAEAELTKAEFDVKLKEVEATLRANQARAMDFEFRGEKYRGFFSFGLSGAKFGYERSK